MKGRKIIMEVKLQPEEIKFMDLPVGSFFKYNSHVFLKIKPIYTHEAPYDAIDLVFGAWRAFVPSADIIPISGKIVLKSETYMNRELAPFTFGSLNCGDTFEIGGFNTFIKVDTISDSFNRYNAVNICKPYNTPKFINDNDTIFSIKKCVFVEDGNN